EARVGDSRPRRVWYNDIMTATTNTRTPMQERRRARRRRWIEALRSGRYTQTPGTLKRVEYEGPGEPAGHCCLGVAVEVYNDIRRQQRKATIPEELLLQHSSLWGQLDVVRQFFGLHDN